jgi:hypothetical protein
MTKWQYLIVRFDYFAGDLRATSVNGDDIRDRPVKPSLDKFINELGDQGWEAVTFNYTPGHGYGFVILKRPQID